MYSYPPEFLLHPVPVMACYGLSGDADEVPSSDSPSQRDGRSGLVDALSTILNSKNDYSFHEATRNPVQAPPFRIITVSKEYTLPTRAPPLAPNMPPPHSNLSPLSPDSPLFPDGLMTPLWIKKHLHLPSVVVGFYDLWDWHTEPGTKRETGPLASQVMIDPVERENDANLASEINSKRKYFQDKGIKFVAVILLKQRYADASIEERLSSIRKQCGLDTKNAFFTVAPCPTPELQEFINNLYKAMHEPALQYYSNRIKKLRKKKSKLPSPSTLPRSAIDLSSNNEAQPLSVPGWILRYDYKTAFFQECKQEIDGALRSYEAAYNTLVDMLAPTSVSFGHNALTMHSKRWTEARILVDCISIKICRFHLHLNDPAAALAQLNGHLHMFQSHSNEWGMGEQTFEYWAWLSKQYRNFADIIDAAIHAGFKIPLPTAHLGSTGPASPLVSGVTPNTGCNPGAILQHPGFYYHLAAMCCAERRRRFLEMEKDTSKLLPEMVALLNNEKQVDHSSVTIELLTKSYEQFKRHRSGRMTLYLAAEIAGTYYETGKFEMAIKFFERIGKTYRKEKWHMVLTSILRWSLRCAKELGSWERAIECLVELMAEDLPMTNNKRADVQKELFDLLSVHPAANAEKHAPIVIHMDQMNAFVKCHVQFRKQAHFLGAPVDYQITLKTEKTSPPSGFRFNALRIMFSNPQYNVILYDMGAETDIPPSELIDFSNTLEKVSDGDYADWQTSKADLRVIKGQTKVLQGSVLPKDCGELKIVGVCLDIITDNWHVELNYLADKMAEEQSTTRRKWCDSVGEKPKFKLLDGCGELLNINVLQKPPSIDLKFEHSAPALLDELFKLDVTMKSSEAEPVEAILIAEIKNAEGFVEEDYVLFDVKKDPSGAVQEETVGRIEPRQSVTIPVYLHGGSVSGSRIINLIVRYTVIGEESTQPVEKTDSLRVPFITPFDTNFELCAQSEKLEITMSPDLEKSERWLLSTSIKCCSAWDLDVKSIELEETESFEHEFTSLSLISKMDDIDQHEWKTGHVFNAIYLFKLFTTDLTETQPSIPAGRIKITWKRLGNDETFYQTYIPLPSIQFQQSNLVVVADAPSEIYLGEPFTLVYNVYNPTEFIAEYTATIELSEAFVFSGYKQLKGRVLPLSRVRYQYNCYPLLAGKVRLPRLKVLATQQQTGEREVPIEMAGSGTVIALDNNLQVKHSNPLEAQPILVFVNAKRQF